MLWDHHTVRPQTSCTGPCFEVITVSCLCWHSGMRGNVRQRSCFNFQPDKSAVTKPFHPVSAGRQAWLPSHIHSSSFDLSVPKTYGSLKVGHGQRGGVSCLYGVFFTFLLDNSFEQFKNNANMHSGISPLVSTGYRAHESAWARQRWVTRWDLTAWCHKAKPLYQACPGSALCHTTEKNKNQHSLVDAVILVDIRVLRPASPHVSENSAAYYSRAYSTIPDEAKQNSFSLSVPLSKTQPDSIIPTPGSWQ